jgi:phosphoglycerol transferase MdoB-like AlkP superfamily enzyme
MKTFGIILASLAFSSVIISPFFWLRFLKEKSVGKYLTLSSLGTLALLYSYIFLLDDFLSHWTAKINADLYYFYDDFSLYPILIVIFLIIISPLIFVKIIWKRFSLKSFSLALLLAVSFFIGIFLFWALVLMPIAFNQLHNYF